jgi:hypothetical protein
LHLFVHSVSSVGSLDFFRTIYKFKFYP